MVCEKEKLAGMTGKTWEPLAKLTAIMAEKTAFAMSNAAMERQIQESEAGFQQFPLAAFEPFFSVDMAFCGFQARMGDCPERLPGAVLNGFGGVEGWNG